MKGVDFGDLVCVDRLPQICSCGRWLRRIYLGDGFYVFYCNDYECRFMVEFKKVKIWFGGLWYHRFSLF